MYAFRTCMMKVCSEYYYFFQMHLSFISAGSKLINISCCCEWFIDFLDYPFVLFCLIVVSILFLQHRLAIGGVAL